MKLEAVTEHLVSSPVVVGEKRLVAVSEVRKMWTSNRSNKVVFIAVLVTPLYLVIISSGNYYVYSLESGETEEMTDLIAKFPSLKEKISSLT
jgi:hypothetical protein